MTVTSQVAKVTGTGDGAAFEFSFSPMVIYASTEIEVTHVSAAGVETVVSVGTGASNYAITVASYPGTGTITYPADEVTPMTSSEKIIMRRVVVLEQQTDLNNHGGYFADTQEVTFDKAVVRDLQQQEEIDRAIKIPISAATTSADISAAAASMVAGGYLRLAADKSTVDFVAISTTTGSASDDTPQVSVDTAGAAGTSGDFSRSDHRHEVSTGTSGTAIPLLDGANTHSGINTFTKGMVITKGADIASAAPLVIGTDGNYFDVTGTTDFAAMTVAAGRQFILQFDGILTMTHGANLFLPNATKNITTAAGDHAICFAVGADSVRVIDYISVDRNAYYDTQSSLSGTTVDFTGLPPGLNQIIVHFAAVSGDAANKTLLLQIGTGGALTTSGYSGKCVSVNSTTSEIETATTGYALTGGTLYDAADAVSGTITLTRVTTNWWFIGGSLHNSAGTAVVHIPSGEVVLAGVLDVLTITSVGGGVTFDLGDIVVVGRY